MGTARAGIKREKRACSNSGGKGLFGKMCLMQNMYDAPHIFTQTLQGCQIRAFAANHRRDFVLDGILDETWK